jgi:hypothetical protein
MIPPLADLVFGLLTLDPEERLSCHAASHHPWLAAAAAGFDAAEAAAAEADASEADERERAKATDGKARATPPEKKGRSCCDLLPRLTTRTTPPVA